MTPEPFDRALARAVGRLRSAAGVPLRVVAEHSGLSVGFLNHVERCYSRPTIDALRRICGVYGIELSVLIVMAEAEPEDV